MHEFNASILITEALGSVMSEGGPFKRLLRYMAPHRGTIRLATFCSILNKIWDLAPPLLIGLAVDVVVQPVGCDGCKWTIKRWRASTCSKFVDVVQPRVVSH